MATDTAEMTVQALATEADGFLVQAKRTNGDKFWKFKDEAPEWCTDMAHEAHGDMLPDDWKYEFVSDALSALSENEDEDEARDSLEIPVYYHEQHAWLASNLNRTGYVDEARSELGTSDQNTDAQIAAGMWMEQREVFDLVLSFLQNKVEEEDE